MKYAKPALSFEEPADLLLKRGLVGDKDSLVVRLMATNYYRFSNYLCTFRGHGENFLSGITVEKIWNLYRFDHGLRLVLLDALETIEVHARTQLAYHFAPVNGPFSYLDSAYFPNFDAAKIDFPSWDRKLRQQVERSLRTKGREDFIIHFNRKYGDSHVMPSVWMMVELMDFGSVLSFYRGVSTGIRRELADHLGPKQQVVLNWLLALSAGKRCLVANQGVRPNYNGIELMYQERDLV